MNFINTLDFLKKLSRNNNREWFEKNKSRYLEIKDEFEIFVTDVLHEMITFDESLAGLNPKKLTFRIYRDVRFSKDKTPYKTNVSAGISPAGKGMGVPGYYFQELSARRFVLLNAQYSLPLDAKKRWNLTGFAASANLDYLPGLEQPGSWNSGLGGGITFKSPAGSWLVTLIYAYGINAIRTDERGANQIGILFQYDFEAKGKWFDPGVSPYRSRGMERIFRD